MAGDRHQTAQTTLPGRLDLPQRPRSERCEFMPRFVEPDRAADPTNSALLSSVSFLVGGKRFEGLPM